MNKKIVIISLVMLALMVLVGVFAYSRLAVAPVLNEENIDNTELSGIEVETGPTNGGGQLVICADKCGDGVCQSPEEKCDSLNCICPEDPKECPQDCK